MSEKTLGQIAFEAWFLTNATAAAVPDFSKIPRRDAEKWEAAASAVRLAGIEECAAIAEANSEHYRELMEYGKGQGLGDDWSEPVAELREIGQTIASAIRHLK